MDAGAGMEMLKLWARTGDGTAIWARDEIEKLRAALQKHAMNHHYRIAEGGGSVSSGYSCDICEVECDGKLSELRHLSTCPLFPLNHQQ